MGPPRATEPGCGAEPHVSWTLREAGKIDPDRLERYLRTEGPRIPRTTVRYAIERFPPEEREALLKATRREANDGR